MIEWKLDQEFYLSRKDGAYEWLLSKEQNQLMIVDFVFGIGERVKVVRHPGVLGTKHVQGTPLPENMPFFGEILARTVDSTSVKVGKRFVPGPMKLVVAPYDFMTYLRLPDRIEESQGTRAAVLDSNKDAFKQAHNAVLSWKGLTVQSREAESIELIVKTANLRRTRTAQRREMNRRGSEYCLFKDSTGRANPLISGCQFLIAMGLADAQIALDEYSWTRNWIRKQFSLHFAADTYDRIERLFGILASPLDRQSEAQLEEIFRQLLFKPFVFAVELSRRALLDKGLSDEEVRERISRAFNSELLLAETADTVSAIRRGAGTPVVRSGLLGDLTSALSFDSAYGYLLREVLARVPRLSDEASAESAARSIEKLIRYRHDSPFARSFIPSELHHMLPAQGVLTV